MNYILTAELIAACEKQGCVVTQPQLWRWRKYGLLPPTDRKGLGRGKGRATALWKDSCVKRACLVAQALQEGDPSLDRAGKVLFARGFPVGSDLMRRYLNVIPKRIDEAINGWRPFLRNSRIESNEKAERLAASIINPSRRSLRGAPDEVLSIIAQVAKGIAGLQNIDDPYGQLGTFFSPSALGTAINRRGLDYEALYAESDGWARNLEIIWCFCLGDLALSPEGMVCLTLSAGTQFRFIPREERKPYESLGLSDWGWAYYVRLVALLMHVLFEVGGDRFKSALRQAASQYITDHLPDVAQRMGLAPSGA